MLEALSIRNFVLVDRLDVTPGSGFFALTGETGAGKSILLDALALTTGAPADRGQIRAGSERASLSAAFSLAPDHAAWSELEQLGIDVDRRELLLLKRVISANGPSRAYVNDQPVSIATLAAVGRTLIEIHGQHAAAALLRPGEHRVLLDRYAGADSLLENCKAAWQRFIDAEAMLGELQSARESAKADLQHLTEAFSALKELAPERGEADRLAADRSRLMQAGRFQEHLAAAETALDGGGAAAPLAEAARRLDQICRLPGYDEPGSATGHIAQSVRDSLERALIELQEAEHGLAALRNDQASDTNALETVEERLFALRAAGRRHGVPPDDLPGVLLDITSRLDAAQNDDAKVSAAEQALKAALAAWHSAAAALSDARRSAARRLEAAVLGELKPLKLDRARLRIHLKPIKDGSSGALGAETVTFEWDANGTGVFGAVSKVASGGELARLCLALNCALASDGSATLIFDEADQGVGGAVAAAIGERLARLAGTRQVLAITHSPQVAASADEQWLVAKTTPRKGLGRTRVRGLDDTERQEEIARMLAGAKITSEARAAAERLLEEGCRQKNLSTA
ncbi:MAG: DNA repair protein RecN [Pseudomonadota bacterium]